MAEYVVLAPLRFKFPLRKQQQQVFHSSEIKVLCLAERFKNLPYFWNYENSHHVLILEIWKNLKGFVWSFHQAKTSFFWRIQLCIWYATIADRSVSALASYSASNSEKKIILNFMKLIYALSEKSRYIRNKHARCSLVLK